MDFFSSWRGWAVAILGVGVSIAHAQQPAVPRPVEPRSVGTSLSPEVLAYRDLHTVALENRLEACRRFVDRFPGTQLSLRAMREAADLFVLEVSEGGANPLDECGRWMGEKLASSEFSWDRYRQASNSVFLDRLETHLDYVRILASVPRTYQRALEELNRIHRIMETRPGLLSARPDLEEQMLFAQCWCLQGKRDLSSAVRSYRRFLEQFPSSDYLPVVLCYAAEILKKTGGDPAQVREYRMRLVDEYPASPEAVMVRQALR